MSELLRFFKDMRDNGYGLAEIAAQLGTSAIAEPVAGFAAMYDPAHGADAIREGMTYQPRTQEAQQYSQSIGNAAKTAIKPAMPIIDTWKKGVDIAGQYSPIVGAGLRTVPTAIGIAMGAKPALQAGRQVSEGLGAMQGRMIANANAPRTLNTGYMGQRGAANFDYRDSHRAPRPQDNGADHALNDIYPDDIYSANAQRYYGTGDPYDKKTFQIINSLRNNPDKKVTIYRAIPDDINADINDGDWVGLTPEYAKAHGDSRFDGKYKILTKEVSAKELHNNGDSIHEWGYNPVQTTPKRPLTEFEQAHLTAQRNAALPVEKGGLGLAPDNTAMDRARAMGFDTEFQHGSGTGNITAFDLLETQKSDPGYLGQAIYGGPIGMKAYTGGGNVYPLLAKSENMQKITPENWNNNSPYSEVSDLFSKDFGNRDKIAQEYTKGKLNKGVTGIIDTSNGKGLEQIAVFDPKNIRSRFAAFDPFNRDSSNILATTAPLVPTTALGAYMYNEKRKKSQGNQ